MCCSRWRLVCARVDSNTKWVQEYISYQRTLWLQKRNFVTCSKQRFVLCTIIAIDPMKLSTPGLFLNVTVFLVQRTVSPVPSQSTSDSPNFGRKPQPLGTEPWIASVVHTALIPIHNVTSIPASRDAPCHETNWNHKFFLGKSTHLLFICHAIRKRLWLTSIPACRKNRCAEKTF
jgi:hypothetical protein